MKARFQPDSDCKVPPETTLIDPEAYDASEQQFAASLEGTASRFVVEAGDSGDGLGVDQEKVAESRVAPGEIPPSALEEPPASQPGAQDPDSWRQEVAARLDKYRARRRPREPRYPSLQLKFEPSEPGLSAPAATSQPYALTTTHQPAETLRAASVVPQPTGTDPAALAKPVLDDAPDATARIIPFPRSAVAPPRPLEELAEPVPSRPRILEVPETAPAPPALGGILIEPAEEPVSEKRPGIEVPLQAASLSRRLLATGIDALILLVGFTLFGYIFFRVAGGVPPFKPAAGMTVVLLAILWLAYQSLLLIYTGSTPGLRLAKLRLNRFDDSAVPRRIRGWRVLAAVLSGISLGLGYAWCLLDEDQLCWHDRITKTYMAPRR